MLGGAAIVAFVGAADLDRARAFYCDILGLKLVEQSDFALELDAAGTMLRVTKVPEVCVAPHTVLGWQVPDIRRAVTELTEKGVAFQRFDGMPQDADGIWATPSGALVAWFKDSDGNTLSLTEFPGE